jgi:hypothetical protein
MPLSSVVGAQSIIKTGVCTSGTRPASPFEGQMIYETDTDKVLVWNGSAWYANWNLPWGVVAYAKKTTSTALTTTDVLVLAAPAFTAVTGRIYKVTAQGYFSAISSSTYYNMSIFNGATRIQGTDWSATTAGPFVGASVHTYATGVSGTTTFSIHSLTGSGTGTFYADASGAYSNVIIVEDIGPV